MKKRNFIILSTSCFIILFLGLVSYSSNIANPFVGIKGLILINTSNDDVIQISDNPIRYISKRDNVKGFVRFMSDKGYNAEQLGSAVSVYNDIKSLVYEIEGFFLSNYNIYTEFGG